MKRFHVHLHVNDLAANIAFYSRLFGAAPTRVEADYAKWMLEDPRVNFAISTRGARAGIDHLGIQTDDPAELAALKARAEAADLKGTVLLAHEGINLMLAGEQTRLDHWLGALQSDPRFATLEMKRHSADHVPFQRLRVKVKREIIRMDHPTIRPAQGRAPAVAPATLRRWLEQGHDDDGRDVVTLDTRNAFEVDAGTFDNAIDWRIGKFTEFPAALQAHKAALQDKTVVSFCTGGIRCEKAAILMQEEGLEHVYQLEGGILKYFEHTDGAHYHGGCFVFDERTVLAPDLSAQPSAKAGDEDASASS